MPSTSTGHILRELRPTSPIAWEIVKVVYAQGTHGKALLGAPKPFAVCDSLLHQGKPWLDKVLLKFREHDVARPGLYQLPKDD